MIQVHGNMQFSTKDRENDIHPSDHCSQKYSGGWWYSNCHESNLNGRYLNGENTLYAQGIVWLKWKGYRYSYKKAEMKIRPKNVQ